MDVLVVGLVLWMGGRTNVETVDMVAVGIVGMLLWDRDLSTVMMLL
jgi:hypothetical protein